MKNLKRILSLALASVMVMGMMVVGASAATFVDQDAISENHVTAVEIVKALGIMNGKEGQKFDPKGVFTRAEMATVIATIHNKGVAPTFAKKQNPTYSDVPNSHWAVSFIEYCTNFGLVGGVGGGKFDPEAPASATQTARMLLNLMGYTVPAGADWALTTETQARSNANLYATLVDEIADPSKSITREQVAQMVNNALNAAMVDEKGNAITTEGGWKLENANTTTAWGGSAALQGLAAETYGTYLEAYTSANTTGKTLGTDYNIVKLPARTTKLGGVYLGMSTQNIGLVTKIDPDSEGKGYRINGSATTGTLVPEDPSALMGLEAEVISKGGRNYGITAVGTVVFEGTVGDIVVIPAEHAATKTIHLGDETFKTADPTLGNTKIHIWNNWSSQTALSASISLNKEYAIKAISNNSKGEIDHIVAMPISIKEIAYISDTNINVTGGYNGAIKDSEGKVLITGTEGLKKGDKVLYTDATNTADNVAVLAKVDTIDGKVDGVRANGSVLVNGTWYPQATSSTITMTPGSEGTLTMINGYYVGFTGKAGAAASTDILFVAKVAPKGNGLDAATWQARVITKEGTYQDIDLGFAASVTDTKAAAQALVGGWHTYTEKDGVYTLTAAKATATAAGYAKAYGQVWYDYTAAAGSTPATQVLKSNSTALRLADDAVVIINYSDGVTTANTDAAVGTGTDDAKQTIGDLKSLKVMTGKELKALGGDLGTNSSTLNVAYSEMVNGIEYVKFVFIANKMKSLPTAVGTAGYMGYVVSDSYSVKVGNKTYTTFDMWDGEDTITVKADGDATAADKGAFITYTDLGDGIIKDVADAGLTNGAVVGSNDKLVSILKGNTSSGAADDTETLTTNDYTLFFYVDSKNVVGKASGAIQNATEDTRVSTNANKLFVNVKYLAANGIASIIVVDVNNSFVDPTDGITLETVQGGKQEAVTVTAKAQTVAETPADATEIPAGTTGKLTLVGTTTGANSGATESFKWEFSEDGGTTWKALSGNTATKAGKYRVTVTVTFQPNQIGAEQQQTATSTEITLTKAAD